MKISARKLCQFRKKSYLYATIPTTSLSNAYHGGTSFLYKEWFSTMATYTNRPICKACQLAELKMRGLVVNDDNKALEYLGSINYFRFACYLQPFEVNSVTHQYIPGTSFDEVVKLCQFDKDLPASSSRPFKTWR